MNNLDYKKIYTERYKKLPLILFRGILLFMGICASIAAIILFILSDGGRHEVLLIVGIVVVLVGWLVAFITACIVFTLSSISISQSVVVADCLLKLSEAPVERNETLQDIENEMPEI